MLNPWLILGALVIWISSLGVVGVWQHKAGSAGERTVWETREAKINADTANAIAAQSKLVADLEHKRAQDINNVAADYEDQLKGKQNALNAARAAAKSTGLFVHGAACPAPIASGVSGAAAGSGVSDGPKDIRLPAETSDFLLGLASESDTVVAQLTACQQIVAADRKN